MSSHNHQFKHYRSAIAIAAVCIAAVLVTSFADMPATAQNRRVKSKYGLGILPVNARNAGGTRKDELSRVTLLAPQDGGITLSERPTFYWYVAPNRNDKDYFRFEIGFRLRDPGDGNLKVVEIKRSGTKVGLYSFTLPSTTPALETGKDRTWMVQDFTQYPNANFINEDLRLKPNLVVRLQKNETVIAELNKAKTNLEKARIFERYGYWYDALHAYTQWIEANPNDTIARRERANMIEEGLKDNCDFRDIKDETAKCDFHQEGQTNLKLLGELQRKIDSTASVDLASFPP
jgi:Domain of Unknown Function (DUF928)